MIARRAEILTALGLTSTATDDDIGLVNMLQPRVERAIENYIGFAVEQVTREELLPTFVNPEIDRDLTSWDVVGGRVVEFLGGSRVLTVTYAPLRSIVAVYEDRTAYAGQNPGAFGPETLLTQGIDFYTDVDETGICRSGQLIRLGSWPGTPRSVKIQYVSGYTRAELDGAAGPIDASDIALAVIEQIRDDFNWYKRNMPTAYRAGGPVISERLADWGVRYDNKDTPASGKPSLSTRVKEILERYTNYTNLM